MSASAVPRSITQLLSGTLDTLASADAGPRLRRKDGSESGPTSTLGALMDALDERAFGLMLLLLALPCCIPFLWGIPQIVALPMLFLTGQLVAGRHQPWLPPKLNQRPFEVAGMQKAVGVAHRYLRLLERLSHPRLTALTEGTPLRVVAALMLIPTTSILLPLPGTNTVPGIGVAIASVGLIERDGLLVIAGLVVGLAWVAMLGLFGYEVISAMKDWLLARF